MATQTQVELFKSDIAAFVGIETGEKRGHALFRNFGKGRNGSKLLESQKTVIAGNLSKLFSASLRDALAKSFAGGFPFFRRDRSVAVGVDFRAAFFAGGTACVPDGLTLLFVDTTVLIDVVFLKEFRQGAVPEGPFVSLREVSSSEQGSGDNDVFQFHVFFGLVVLREKVVFFWSYMGSDARRKTPVTFF
jgi:hypothetical protein